MQKGKRLIGQQCNGLIDMLKIGEPDTDHDHSEECVIVAVDAFTEKDDLRSLNAVDRGIADEDAFIVAVFEVQKVVTISKVKIRRGPLLCRIHQPTIPVR